MQKDQMKKGSVGDLINWSEVARRLGLSPRYVVMLRHGQRKSKRRLKQIEELIRGELSAVGQYWHAEGSSSADQHQERKNEQKRLLRNGNSLSNIQSKINGG